MIELFILAEEHIQGIPKLLGVVNMNEPAQLCLDVLDCANPFVENVDGRQWNRFITNEHPLKYGDR